MSSSHLDKLRNNIREFPDSPGVYIMKNAGEKVIYVGKAKSLPKRIRSYFQDPDRLDIKSRALVKAIEKIDYIATANEVEALVLEYNLIKEYRPKYNIRLKDDKRYPFIKLTSSEKFPRLLVSRSIEKDGSEYFGPYTDAGAVRRTLDLLRSIFPTRDCSNARFSKATNRECLNYHINRCPAPCTGQIGEDEYGEIITQIRLFLKGKNGELLRILKDRMRCLSEELRYEDASIIRDQILAIEKLNQRQHAVSTEGEDEDVLAVSGDDSGYLGIVMKVRDGKVLRYESFVIPAVRAGEESDVFNTFFEYYYHSATDIPPEIIVQSELHDHKLAETWLKEKTGYRIRIIRPVRGKKRKLVQLAERNAMLKIAHGKHSSTGEQAALRDLKKILGLTAVPSRIEACDISNIQGTDAVGSLVTFVNGVPYKRGYRHFKIKETKGIDDYAMLEEVLRRRLGHLKEGKEKAPDLLLIDGGKGQVSSAMKVLKEMDIQGILLLGLAKVEEDVYIPGLSQPLRLPRTNRALQMLQRIRDEAHRFAIEYHRKLRGKRIERSVLDEIPGIGKYRKIALLTEFGSVEALRRASIDELESVPGIGERYARRVFEFLEE